jgi:uncharacterized protein YndB with AHSA1/START domain
MDNFVADAIYIDAHPARVFEALLDPEEVLVWLDADSVFIDPRPGGVFKAQRAGRFHGGRAPSQSASRRSASR